jgi:hypothetical protein
LCGNDHLVGGPGTDTCNGDTGTDYGTAFETLLGIP